jgi:hypothetical protein
MLLAATMQWSTQLSSTPYLTKVESCYRCCMNFISERLRSVLQSTAQGAINAIMFALANRLQTRTLTILAVCVLGGIVLLAA